MPNAAPLRASNKNPAEVTAREGGTAVIEKETP
jgi:hypothetical protein